MVRQVEQTGLESVGAGGEEALDAAWPTILITTPF
jgi:hypothetical protein